MKQLTLTLQENAESFLKEALTKALLAESAQSEWKFAIFNLVQAIELVLKEKLRREHPLLVFANVENPKISVSLQNALVRLARIESIKLTEIDVKNIHLANAIRNEITHHTVDISLEQIKIVFSKLLGFIIEFCRKQLDMEISTSMPDELWKEAVSVEAYASELYNRATKQLAEEGIGKNKLITCIKCWYDTYVDIHNIYRCYLCGFAEPTTICQECGLGMFESEGQKVYYGKWISHGEKEPKDWYPHLCNECYDKFLENDSQPVNN